MSSDDAEILRLRDRQHDLEASVVALRFQLDDLREWRAETRVLLERCRMDLDGVMDAQTVAEQVAERLKDARGARWTRSEKMIGVLVAAGTLATAVHGWVA